jgi:hypothetical protein
MASNTKLSNSAIMATAMKLSTICEGKKDSMMIDTLQISTIKVAVTWKVPIKKASSAYSNK